MHHFAILFYLIHQLACATALPRVIYKRSPTLKEGVWTNQDTGDTISTLDIMIAFKDQLIGSNNWKMYGNSEGLVNSQKQLWEHRVGTGKARNTMRVIATFDKFEIPEFRGVLGHSSDTSNTFKRTFFDPSGEGAPRTWSPALPSNSKLAPPPQPKKSLASKPKLQPDRRPDPVDESVKQPFDIFNPKGSSEISPLDESEVPFPADSNWSASSQPDTTSIIPFEESELTEHAPVMELERRPIEVHG